MSLALSHAAGPATGEAQPIKVMVVDDAVVVRGLVGRWLAEEPDMILVAAHRSARDAVADIARKQPDVVILDIEMPDMDGMTALPLMIAEKRDLVVVMASTLTRRNAEISLRALSLGAADYVPKPESNAGVTMSPAFRRELIDKVRALGRKRRIGQRHGQPAAELRSAAPASHHTLRPFSTTRPKVLAIGASTGGPQALSVVLKALGTLIDQVPVLITQHMPPTFTTILAEHAAKSTGRPAAEAQDGEPILPGRVYVAPGAKHFTIVRDGTRVIARLDDGPPIQFCKPAVNPLFQSVAQVYGAAGFGCVLTGMGSDGAQGAAAITAAGGSVIAQDEASSVVWGMPGAVTQAGLASAVLPLNDIAPRIVRVFAGDRS